ncbi:MAG: hypothetical protein ACTSQY_09455 [Candidatus Odinarchaeia archaeon]
MLKCEICYEWRKRIEITEEWWDLAKNDWNLLNGKDLPYYIAILTVLRETYKEIYHEPYNQNHSKIKTDKHGYSLIANKNCEFTPLTQSQKSQWRGLNLTIKSFRNSSAHISNVKGMNPVFTSEIKDPEDATQNFYRYAPFPNLYHDLNRRKPFNDLDLIKIHELVRSTILSDVRSSTPNLASHRIKYELGHVERGPFIDLLHNKVIELLKEIKVW